MENLFREFGTGNAPFGGWSGLHRQIPIWKWNWDSNPEGAWSMQNTLNRISQVWNRRAFTVASLNNFGGTQSPY